MMGSIRYQPGHLQQIWEHPMLTTSRLACRADGVAKYDLADIGYERPNGYSWLGCWPAKLLEHGINDQAPRQCPRSESSRRWPCARRSERHLLCPRCWRPTPSEAKPRGVLITPCAWCPISRVLQNALRCTPIHTPLQRIARF